MDSLFPQHNIGHGHGPQLHILRCQHPRSPRLRVAIEEYVLLHFQGALDMFCLKAQVALHNDLNFRKGEFLRSQKALHLWGLNPFSSTHLQLPDRRYMGPNQVELLLGLFGTYSVRGC